MSKKIEHSVRDKLAKALSGQTEIETPVGVIDVLTESEVIEVKHVSQWKAALGQVLVYGIYYPGLVKRIHIYGKVSEQKLALIAQSVERFDVRVTHSDASKSISKKKGFVIRLSEERINLIRSYAEKSDKTATRLIEDFIDAL